MHQAIGFALTAALTAPAIGFAQRAPALTVRAENALAMDRTDETVAVAWATVKRALPDAAPGRVRVTDANGAERLSQVVDNDGDGTMDELIFVADFRPMARETFTIVAAAPNAKAASR